MDYFRQALVSLVAILSAILFIIVCTGCGGTRNAVLSKTETKTDNINIENSYSIGSKIILMDIFTAKPIDALKPMWINGNEYRNAVISNDKSKIETKYFKLTEKIIIYKTIVIKKNKTTTRTDNTMLWLGMFLIVVVAVFAWFYLPKIKTGI